MDFHDAVALLTAPGQPFETERITIPASRIGDLVREPVEVTAFRHAPATLRLALSTRRTDDVFLVYEDERWTFAQVMETVDALAHQLVHDYGVGRGDRVAIGMRNYPEWVLSFAAIVSIGAVSVSLNAWWTEEELDYALEDSGATVLIADRERCERSRAAAERLGFRTIGVRGAGELGLAGVDAWAPPLGTSMPDVDVQPDDDATILYTSGTTGRPKGAVSTHRAITQSLMAFSCRSSVEAVRRQAQLPAGEAPAAATPPSFILIVPLFHVTGCIPVMLSTFVGGLKLVMMYKWDPLRALQLIERERVTNFVGVPTQSWDLLECPDFATYDTSSLVSVGGGGAPAPPELVKRVEGSFRTGRPQIGYGMTETNAYGPGNTGDDYVTHPTSTGRAVPILELEVRDPEGVAVPTGELGEIWFKGPHLIRGYWNKPEATEATIVDGWLRSGDLGRVDEEGFVYVVDRVKDMVLRAGENVYCAEVEAAIYEHPAVYEAAVFGVPHERLGEEVATVIMLRPGASLTADELTAFLKAHIASYKVPTRIAFRDEQLPRNASGKMLKRELRDVFTS